VIVHNWLTWVTICAPRIPIFFVREGFIDSIRVKDQLLLSTNMSGKASARKTKVRKVKDVGVGEQKVEGDMGTDGRVDSKSGKEELLGDITAHNGDAANNDLAEAGAGSSCKRKLQEEDQVSHEFAIVGDGQPISSQNGCLDDRFKFVDELARKDFSLFTPEDLAILFTRWYRGCEKEAQEMVDKRISGTWICDNIRGGQFIDWIVDAFVIPLNTSFMVAQRIFGFIKSKICGGGNPACEVEAVYADLTLCEVYVSEFESLNFDMETFTRAVRARGIVQDSVQTIESRIQAPRQFSESERQRQAQIEHFEKSQARKAAAASQYRGPAFSTSVGRENTVEKRAKVEMPFGTDFVGEEFLPGIEQSDATKKCKAPAIVWPNLTRMDYKAFAEFFKKYKKSVEEGNDSAQFRSLKSCIDIDLRDTVRRKLKVNFEDYKKLDDQQVTLRLFRYFGPIDYDSAVKFLKGAEMPNHSDDVDSQSLFMAKFDRHIKEFSLRINIIKACMIEVAGCTAVSTSFKDLTKVKLMQIYENSFHVLKDKSCQAWKCWSYIKDFKKVKSFDEINSHLTDVFDEKDRIVKDGNLKYTTEPKSKGAGGGGGSAAVHKSSGGGGVKDATKKFESKQKKVVKGCDRGQACGNETNHHGAGCNLQTCVIFGTKHAVAKDFVWPDSDKMGRIDVGREVWAELNKAKPEVALYNTKLRDEKLKRWAKENEEKRKMPNGTGSGIGKKRDGNSNDTNAEKKVKVNNYSCVAADFFGWDSNVDLTKMGISSQFFAESNFGNEDIYYKVLLDSGAGLNAIHEELLKDVDILDTKLVNLSVSNFGEKFCECQKAVQLKFSLTGIDGKEIEYTEWFCIWNVSQHKLVLGREFLKVNKFTTFDDRLRKWSMERKCEVQESVDRAFSNSVKQSSRHPIQGYQFYRDPEGPRVYKIDHEKNVVSFEACIARSAVCSAANIAEKLVEENLKVRALGRTYRRMCSKVKQVVGDEIEDEFRNRTMLACDVATVTADILQKFKRAPTGSAIGTTQSGAIWRSTLFEEVSLNEDKKSDEDAITGHKFMKGEVFTVANCNSFSQFNGSRARVYEPVSDQEGVYFIRTLGKKKGWWTIHERNMEKCVANAKEAAATSAHKASYLDVGIDESGNPEVEEVRPLVHRQFGKFISAALTKRIDALNEKYPDVWSDDISEPCTFEPLAIKLLPNSILPSSARFYRNTPKMRNEVREQIQEQMAKGIISPAITTCVSNVLLVKRPHMPGKWRFVVDYRKLNDLTVPEPLQMCDPKAQFETLMGKEIFGCIDMRSFYRQILLEESSRMFTGFATEDGTFVYNRVPMGIKNACSYSQRKLQEVLARNPVLFKAGVKNFFDDVPIGAMNDDEFLDIVKNLLDVCRECKLKLNKEKSVLGVDSITHLGFIIDRNGRRIDEERMRDIKELQAPKSVKKVQSILGILNFVRDFIPDFSVLAKCLTDKLKSKKNPWSWSKGDDENFRILIGRVMEAGVLEFLDYSKPIYVQCDACNFGCGAVLFQYDDLGRKHVVCYASRKYSDTESRYSTFQQEAGAIVWALERFKEYTMGYHVIVETDHKNLSYVKRSTMPQLERWRLRLQEFDFEIHYLQGCLNHVADGLSRKSIDELEISLQDILPEGALDDAAPPEGVVLVHMNEAGVQTRSALYEEKQWSSGQDLLMKELALSSDDEKLFEVCAVSEGELSDSDTESEASDHQDEDGACVDGVESVLNSVENENENVTVEIPSLSPRDEIDKVHNALVGHNGVYVTLQRLLKNDVQWANRAEMIRNIDDYLKGCVVCQKMRKRSSRHKYKVDRFMLEGSPFAELSVDILKLPNADVYGNLYVIVVVDNFSHWVSLYACKNKTAQNAARAIMQTVANFGVPLTIRSDGGKEFVNATLNALSALLGTKHHVVLPYTPTANSVVERVNRAILEKVRDMVFEKTLVKHSESQWTDLLPLAQRIINGSFHSSIGTSPAAVLFGGSVDLNRCLLSKMPAAVKVDVETYEGALIHNQRVLIDAAERHHEMICKKVMDKAEKLQDTKLEKEIQVDDWVVVRPEIGRPLHKLASRLMGPYCVFGIKGEIVSVLTGDRKIRHFLKRNCEVFDRSQLSSVEGMKQVAERDNFEYPVEAIWAHALIGDDGFGAGDEVQLTAAHKRAGPKSSYQFLIKWYNHEEPTWQPFKHVKSFVLFPAYVARFPGLKM
jgi:hypothetical protein